MTHTYILKQLIISLGLFLLFSAAGCRKTDISLLGNNLTCYAAAYNKGVYKSENGGISWYPLATDQDDIYFYSKRLFFSPDAKTLYVATTGNGLFSIDMEKGSLNRMNGFKDEDVRSVVFRKATNGQGPDLEIFVAQKETGIYKTVPGKDSWEPFNNGLTYRDVNVLFRDSGDFLAGTIKGLFKWDGVSNGWNDSSEGLKNKNIISMSSAPEDNTIYAGSGVYEGRKGWFEDIPCLYKSTDKGNTWVVSDDGLPEGALIFCITVNPAKPERIYAGTNQGIYISTDSGENWSKTDNGLPDKFLALDIKIVKVSGDKALVYASGANGLYMALDDKSQEWISRNYGLEQTYISSMLFVTGSGN
jgi:photosystem II stability/assembly factor-like uncharacterized protein